MDEKGCLKVVFFDYVGWVVIIISFNGCSYFSMGFMDLGFMGYRGRVLY